MKKEKKYEIKIEESLQDDHKLLDKFMDDHYYGLPEVKLKDMSSEELVKMRDIARRVRDSYAGIYGRNPENNILHYLNKYRKVYELLADAAKDAKEKEAGTYEIKKQIESDIWDTVSPSSDVDFDALRELRQKYKDYPSLFNSIRKRIIDRERWMIN